MGKYEMEPVGRADIPRETRRTGVVPKGRVAGFFYRLGCLDYFLLAIGFAIFVMGVVFAYLWWNQNTNIQMLQTALYSSSSTCSDNAQCLIQSNKILTSMNATVNPCADFYSYSCGGFINTNKPNINTGETSSTSLLQDQRLNDVLRILTGDRFSELQTLLFNSDADLLKLYNQMVTYYSSCKATVLPNVYSYIALSNTSATITNATLTIGQSLRDTIFSLSTTDSDTVRKLHVAMWINSPDLVLQLRGQDQYGNGIFASGLFDLLLFGSYNPVLAPNVVLSPPVLPFGGNYSDPNTLNAYKNAIFASLVSVQSSWPITPFDFNRVSALVDFEKSLSQLMTTARPTAIDGTWTPTSTGELQRLYPNIMGSQGWSQYLLDLGFPSTLVQGASTSFPIYNAAPSFFSGLDTLIANTAVSVIMDFSAYVVILEHSATFQLHGTMIPSFAPSTNTFYGLNAFQQIINVGTPAVGPEKPRNIPKLLKRSLVNPETSAARKSASFASGAVLSDFITPAGANIHRPYKQAAASDSYTNNICVADVQEKFGLVLARMFAALNLPDATRSSVMDLVATLKSGFKARINDPSLVSWLDDSSRATLISKVDMMTPLIGYPVEIMTTSFLTDFYSAIDSTTLSATNQFPNILQTVRNLNSVQPKKFSTDFGTVQLMLSVDWTQADAYYVNFVNKFVLPMGMIRPTTFSATVGPSVNYGALGFILAHEMAHSFDPENVPYDQYGAYNPSWLSQATIDLFAAEASCFQAFYPRYLFNKVPVDGTKTLAQNVADHGGLVISFAAYKASANTVVLPGLTGISNDKLFWINFAQMWCANNEISVLIAKMASPYETHPIARFRVNGALTLMPEFASTFSCPVYTSEMNRVGPICKIW